MAAPLIIADKNAVGPIGADEIAVTFRPAAVGTNALLLRVAFEKHCVFGEHVRSELTERGNIIDDPDAPAMSGQHKI